jgi:hypothetical protein
LLWVSLLALAPVAAISGPLYGTVRVGGAPAAGISIIVACPGFSAGASARTSRALTDSSGGYSLNIAASGRCQMRLEGNGRTGNAFDVFLADNPALFDFQIDGALNRVN